MFSVVLALAMFSANPQAPVRATVESIHDGDTLRLTIHLPFGVDLPARDVRAAGYDAWEIDRRRRTVVVTDAEIAKGKEAREYLSQLLAIGGCWVEDTGQRDPYGRLSVRLWGRNKNGGDWIDVAEEMQEAGYDRGGRVDGQSREGVAASGARKFHSPRREKRQPKVSGARRRL